MKIKAIVFDYGGVLVTNSAATKSSLTDDIAATVGVTTDDFRQAYFKYNYLTNIENQPWINACLRAVAEFNVSSEVSDRVRKLVKDFNDSTVVNKDLVDRLPELTTAYTLAILSNYTLELRAVLTSQGLHDYFDRVFVSSEIGFQKPRPSAFAAVYQSLNINPEEMVFIDDSRKSLETAHEVGYTPILFQNNAQLFSDFEKLGVLPKG